MLYLVPTPIGHLKDITLRAIEVLSEVQLVLAEDTRTSKKLLNHYNIDTPLQSFHQHNEHHRVESYVEQLISGIDIALISDAGTPAISDPGFLLVREALKANVEIDCLPGATALIPALVMSGFPSDKFYFEGFLPQKKGRQTRLLFLKSLPCTFILYESPHRLLKCLKELNEHFPDQGVAVVREISKIHQEVQRGLAIELHEEFSSRPSIKGEIVIVVSKPGNPTESAKKIK